MPPEPRADQGEVAKLRQVFETSASGGGSAAVENLAEPTGWATLRGTFKLDGTPPANPALSVQDPAMCAPGGKTVYSQSVVVDPATKGIANVVIYVDKIPDPWVHEDAKNATDEVIFDQKECIFLSHVATMQTSQKLRVLNSDPKGHNTKIDGTSFNESVPAAGFAIFTPSKQSRAPQVVGCSVHPWMKAYLLIRDNAYMAVTKPDGTFEIPNLPAGVELDFKVWQEKANGLEDVTLNGSSVKWKKGKMKFTLDAEDESKNQLDVVVNASILN